MAILALDQGTSGSKALVVDDDGIHAVVEKPIHPRYLPGGAVEQDPMELYASLIDAGREAVERAGKPIDGVSLANQGETVLAWDPDTSEPLTPASCGKTAAPRPWSSGCAATARRFTAAPAWSWTAISPHPRWCG